MSKSWQSMSQKMPPLTRRYSSGGSGLSREQHLISRSAPNAVWSCTCARSWRKLGSTRRWYPTMKAVSDWIASSITSRSSSGLCDTGFSVNTCFFAFSAAKQWP